MKKLLVVSLLIASGQLCAMNSFWDGADKLNANSDSSQCNGSHLPTEPQAPCSRCYPTDKQSQEANRQHLIKSK